MLEGDSGTRRVSLPIRYSGRGTGQVRVFLVDYETQEVTSFAATVRPGQRFIRSTLTITGDTAFGYGHQYAVGMTVIRGLVVADYLAQVTVDDDDPPPEYTVEPVADSVAEGGTLRWRISVSEPAEVELYAVGTNEPVATELSTLDVDPVWLLDVVGELAEPERPLSSIPIEQFASIPRGELSTEVIVPTVADDVNEPVERVALRIRGSGQELQELGTFRGTVTPEGAR